MHRLYVQVGLRIARGSVISEGVCAQQQRLFSSAVSSHRSNYFGDGNKIPESGTVVRNLSAMQGTKALGTTKAVRGAEWLMSHFPEVLKESTDHVLKYSNPETANHFSKALQYTMSGGKRNRGLTTTQAYEAFAGSEKLTEENLKLSAILGLTMEMSQAWLLGLDDIVDDSKLRRGRPCYYLTDVGLGAINDCVLISKVQYYLLKKYFGHLRCYSKLMEIFNQGELITMCGQTTDFLSSKKAVADFTIDLYKTIVANKTAHYTYNLPAALGMAFANFHEPQLEKEIHSILLEIGCYFQVQDDFLDGFGSPEVIGKVGNDIQEGKCTWLAVKFLETATEEQRREFEEIYGSSEEDKVNRVKALYKAVELPELYKTFENDSYHMIKTRINLLPDEIPKALFHGFIDNIHERSV